MSNHRLTWLSGLVFLMTGNLVPGTAVAALPDIWSSLCYPPGPSWAALENPMCALVNRPDLSAVNTLTTQVYATAFACLHGAGGCPAQANTPPPPPGPLDLDRVRHAVNQAVAIAEACLSEDPTCPATRLLPDPSPIQQLVSQAYAVADACLGGAPECPAPLPPGPDPDPVYQAVAQAVAIAEACLNGATGCLIPPSSPPPTESSAGLGGYRICDIPEFSLDGHLASSAAVDASNPLPRANRLVGTGTGTCTKDGTSWVDVTFSFDGTDQDALSCVTDPSAGTYSLRGPFAINDGTSTAQTEATLTIAAAYIDTWTRTISADFDLPEVEMRSSFHVFEVLPPLKSTDSALCIGTESCPIGTPPVQTPDLSTVLSSADPLPPVGRTAFWVQFGVDPSLENGGPLYGSACYQPTIDHLRLTGSFETVEPVTAAADEVADQVDDEADDEYAEAKDQLPEEQDGLAEGEGGGLPVDLAPDKSGIVLTEEVALAFSNFMDAISSSFAPSLTPGVPRLADMDATAAYLITVKYKTAAGSQTIQTVATVGAKVPVMVPNANNANVPELIYVTLTLNPSTGKQTYLLLIERTTSGSIVLPIDANISWPPSDALQSTSDFAALFGFEGLSVGGGAPNVFRLGASIASSSDSDDISATTNIDPGPNAAALDIVGRYKVTSEQTDLALRMHMPNPVRKLTLTSSRVGGKRLVSYDADITVPEISLVGTREGKEFSLRMSDVAPILNFCSDQGDGCRRPWRVYDCSSKWARLARRPPTYCPIAMSSSVSYDSWDRFGHYQKTNLSLISHGLTKDENGAVVADTVTTVSDFEGSQFGFDSWTEWPRKRYYLDTRRTNVSLYKLKVEKYDGNGSRNKYFSIGGEFKAESRELTIKKHRIKYTNWHYYTAHASGWMYCHGDLLGLGSLRLDMNDAPPWFEELIAFLICYCYSSLCAIW